MAKKRYINTKFWSDNYISDLDPIEKLLFIYFITNQYTDICGIYEITLRQVALDTGIDREEMLPKIIKRFQKDKKIYFVDGWIYIKNFAKHQNVNESIEKGIERSLAEVPDHVLAKIRQIDTECTQSVPTLPPEPDLLTLTPTLTPKPKPTPNGRGFSIFWDSYPKRIGKAKAKKIFEKLDSSLLPKILDSINKQKTSPQWTKDNGQFIPHPATWLNQERWEDEVTPQTAKNKFEAMEQLLEQHLKPFEKKPTDWWEGISLWWVREMLRGYEVYASSLKGQQLEQLEKAINSYDLIKQHLTK